MEAKVSNGCGPLYVVTLQIVLLDAFPFQAATDLTGGRGPTMMLLKSWPSGAGKKECSKERLSRSIM
jgi:hypothetical protein